MVTARPKGLAALSMSLTVFFRRDSHEKLKFLGEKPSIFETTGGGNIGDGNGLGPKEIGSLFYAYTD